MKSQNTKILPASQFNITFLGLRRKKFLKSDNSIVRVFLQYTYERVQKFHMSALQQMHVSRIIAFPTYNLQDVSGNTAESSTLNSC